MKSIFSMFAYWDRVHQFPDGHIAYERRNKKSSSS